MKKILFLLLLFLLSLFVNAGKEDYTIYYGTITLNDGTTTSNVAAGQTLTATIGGVTSGSVAITTAGEYTLVVTCTLAHASCDGAAITFSLTTPSGYDSVNTIIENSYSTSNNWKYTELNLAFTGTPTAVAAAAAAEAGAGGAAMAAPAVPTPEALTKVDITTIPDIIASLPEGWVNVDVYQVGTPTTETVTETLATLVDNALKHAIDPKVISILQNIQNKLKTKEISQISVSKTLNVYKITNKDTGQSIYRSKITLTFTAPKDLINVNIVEVVPHSVIDSIEGIYFPGIKPEILQTNPIFQWSFDNVKKDETKSIDYIIKKKIDKIETITVASAEEKRLFPTISKTVVGIMIIVVIVLIGLAIYYYYLRKKEVKKK